VIQETGESAADVAVVICTRDRPAELRRAIASVLRSDFPIAEFLVVDQSGGVRTQRMVERFQRLAPALRYIRSQGRGLSVARNEALRASSATFVVFTDDDCRVRPDWVRQVARALAADGSAGLAFGEVTPAACPPEDGFIVGYHVPRHQTLRGRFAKRLDGGIGANMAVRRSHALAIGGFDEVLGAGAYFPSCEDGDFAYRTLKSGAHIVHVPSAEVVHYGIRDWTSGKRLTRTTYLAVSAAYFKHARCWDAVGLYLVVHEAGRAAREIAKSALGRRRPLGVGRLAYLGVGIARSFDRKVDRRTGLYV
jgi:GT2 family glycosyltransferase